MIQERSCETQISLGCPRAAEIAGRLFLSCEHGTNLVGVPVTSLSVPRRMTTFITYANASSLMELGKRPRHGRRTVSLPNSWFIPSAADRNLAPANMANFHSKNAWIVHIVHILSLPFVRAQPC